MLLAALFSCGCLDTAELRAVVLEVSGLRTPGLGFRSVGKLAPSALSQTGFKVRVGSHDVEPHCILSQGLVRCFEVSGLRIRGSQRPQAVQNAKIEAVGSLML